MALNLEGKSMNGRSWCDMASRMWNIFKQPTTKIDLFFICVCVCVVVVCFIALKEKNKEKNLPVGGQPIILED